MKSSRTRNAIRNIIAGFINKVIILLFPFILRTIIIKTLGTEYLGLNSLYTSILQVLNLSELGFSSAIVFSMYKPIADRDEKTICALMNLYKKIYRVIGIVIFLIGIGLMPFLNFFIKGSYPNDINLYTLFLLYLINTSVTYFLFSYKSSLLIAHQRADITSNVLSIVGIFQYVVQIIVLLMFKNLYLYIAINIISTVLNNLIVAYIANKKYPEYRCNGNISNELKKSIKKRVYGLMIQKICSTTRNSLDSIFISSFLGLTMVTLYTNYYTIMSAVLGLMSIISSAILAGVGNSIATESIEKNYNDMKKFNYMYMIISGWCTIFLLCLYQPFIQVWMGKEYLLSYDIVVLICLYFYALKMGDIRATYSDAKGLWWENRYRAIAESITNIVLNLALVKIMGLQGIVLATLISLLIINFGYGSQILFKYYFKDIKVVDYFKLHFKYFLINFLTACITVMVCNLIKVEGMLSLIIRGILCLIIPASVYFIIYHNTNEFKSSLEVLCKEIRKK